MVEVSRPMRPVLRAFAPRTRDCFEAFPEVDLAPWSEAEPDRTGAVEADWGDEPELNVEAEWMVFVAAGCALLTRVVVEGWTVEAAPARVSGRAF